eukprot:2033369-Prymnesium_polylepis.1
MIAARGGVPTAKPSPATDNPHANSFERTIAGKGSARSTCCKACGVEQMSDGNYGRGGARRSLCRMTCG